MSYKTMESLKDMLCEELDEIVETGHIGTNELDIVHKITDTIKNVDKIETDVSYGRGRSYGRHYVRGHYSNANESMMLADKMDEMIRSNNSMSSQDKDTLRRAMDMLR